MHVPKATVVFRCYFCGEELVHDGPIGEERGPKFWAIVTPLEHDAHATFAGPATGVLACADCRPQKRAHRVSSKRAK